MERAVAALDSLQTEKRNPRTASIDRVPTRELCQILNLEDLFYIGAGTSGRLGVLDASEIPPTYSAPSGQFVALVAGGDYALRHAKEGAEDDRDEAVADLLSFNLDPNVDSLIGIASSGRTPYVLGGLSYVRSLEATTIALVCVSPSVVKLEGNADYLIPAVTGPEAVTGSTRMKAGTVTKLVLNMISTGIMIKLGKTYGNLMIDVKATNVKLKHRARDILRFVGGDACPQSDAELDRVLASCRGSVKLAAVTIVLKLSVTEAEDPLRRNKGILAHVFNEVREKETQKDALHEGLVLCVDAGGTSCKAVLMSKNGGMGMGMASPCNVTNIGINAAISTISRAVQEAVKNCKTTEGQPMQAVKPSAAWIGMAGYGRKSLSSAVNSSLSQLLGLPISPKLKVTADIDLLPTSLAGRIDLESVVVLVAGTGSIAMSYEKVSGQFQQTHCVGGWGYLLGDDGSGYSIGREAIRAALYSSDIYRIKMTRDIAPNTEMLPHLSQAVFRHFKELYPESRPENLLSTILVPDPTSHQVGEATLETAKRISGVAKLVLSMAGSDNEAKRIVDAGVSILVDLVAMLVQVGAIDPSKSGLVLAGGMMQDERYRESLVSALEVKCGKFKHTERVFQPAVVGARYLLSQLL
ncbi:putative glucokinase regulator family protein [Hypoxylon argillaceum]|nr:putative glucokinase regulator family protein [Hypoxylon argillaceum]